jgi:hypothetical protein
VSRLRQGGGNGTEGAGNGEGLNENAHPSKGPESSECAAQRIIQVVARAFDSPTPGRKYEHSGDGQARSAREEDVGNTAVIHAR